MAKQYGFDERLTWVQDKLFEGLPVERALLWHKELYEAIPVGCDTAAVVDRWTIWLLTEQALPHNASSESIKRVIGLYERKLAGDMPNNDEWAQAAAEVGRAGWAADVAAWAAKAVAERAEWTAVEAEAAAAKAATASDPCTLDGQTIQELPPPEPQMKPPPPRFRE